MTSRRQTERAIEAHADELSGFANVVGIGLTETDRDRASSERSLAVAVYVTQKKSSSELDADDLLPGFVEIEEQGRRVKVPVKVIEMGDLGPERSEGDTTENHSNDDDEGSTFSPQ